MILFGKFTRELRMSNKLLDVENARVPKQKKQMEEILQKGICPFCPEHFKDNHEAPVFFENSYWFITKNDYPYDGAKTHLLIIHKAHIESLSELSMSSMISFHSALQWVNSNFDLPGGTLLMRFGDMSYTGATIAHLHAHIVTGEKKRENTESLKAKIGYKNTPSI